MEDRLIRQVTEMEINLARQVDEGLSKVRSSLTDEFAHWSAKLIIAVDERLDAKFANFKLPEPQEDGDADVVRQQRKKLSKVVDSIQPAIEKIMENARSSIIQTKEQVMTGVASGISTTVNAVREVSVAAAKEQIRHAVSGKVVLTSDYMNSVGKSVGEGLDKVMKTLAPEVTTTIRDLINKDLSQTIAPSVTTTAQSLQSLILHDVRGAIDGETKKMLEDVSRRVIDTAAREAHVATSKFFADQLKDFTLTCLNSVKEAIREALVENPAADGKKVI